MKQKEKECFHHTQKVHLTLLPYIFQHPKNTMLDV